MSCCDNPLCRERQEELEEQIRWLESQLDGELGAEFVLRFGLTGTEGAILSALVRPGIRSIDALVSMLERRSGNDLSDANVKVYICKIRSKLKPFGVEIITHWGVGYSLSDETRQQLSGAQLGRQDVLTENLRKCAA